MGARSPLTKARGSGGRASSAGSALHRHQAWREQGDAQTHRTKVKSNSGQGQRVLSSKMSLTAALSELETLRNVSQVVMEKSLPHFLQTEEQNISANRLKQTYSLLCRRLKIQQMSQE